jgi:hypothetical protein
VSLSIWPGETQIASEKTHNQLASVKYELFLKNPKVYMLIRSMSKSQHKKWQDTTHKELRYQKQQMQNATYTVQHV